MGLLSWLGNGINGYLDGGVNASLAGVPAGLINTAQTGIGPQPDGVAPMMTPQERKALRANFLMHLGQGISQGMPAAHLDDFRNDAIQSAVMRQQLQQQQQEQSAAAAAFAPQQTAPPVLGGAAPPIAPPNGASAAPGMAAPVMGGAPSPAPIGSATPPPTAKPGDPYRRMAQAITIQGRPGASEKAAKYIEIADKLDKDPTKENQGAPVMLSQGGRSILHQGTKEGPGVDTPFDPSLKDQAQTSLYGDQATKAKVDAQALDFQNIGRVAGSGPMTQAQWTSMLGQATPATRALLPAMYSPEAQAAAVKLGVSPDKSAELAAAANKPADEWGAFSAAYAQKLGAKNFKELTPDQQMAALPMFAQQKADPDVKASLLASRALADSMRQIAINQMPTQDQADSVAQDLIAHRIAPDQLSALVGGMGSQGTAFKRMVVGAAKKQDPEFNFEDASAQYQLVKSPRFQTNIRLMDGLTNSLARLQSSADKLANGKVRSLNQIKNFAGGQLNGVDLKSFNTDRLLVADDAAQLLGGGGTGAVTSDSKLNNAMSVWKESDDPAAIAAASKEVAYLIGIRKAALTKGTFLEKSDEPTPKAGGVIVQHSPSTGAYRYSKDGGKTWLAGQP